MTARRCEATQSQPATTTLDTLDTLDALSALGAVATALGVKTDDLPKDAPQFAPQRPTVGVVPQLSEAGLVTLAMTQSLTQAMLGHTFVAGRLRGSSAPGLAGWFTSAPPRTLRIIPTHDREPRRVRGMTTTLTSRLG
ncbi:hypothetical protein ACGFW5_24360 [Streptomyces sp. NPDC048416]|uniref:hypothetical protein n=1 Tax=Streptomyces sp. NPDC048416 TaxID=3365546 RepID=UPI00371C8B71